MLAVRVHERLRVNFLAAARVARPSIRSVCWMLVGCWACLWAGWECDVTLPAWQSGRRDVVAVGTGPGLE